MESDELKIGDELQPCYRCGYLIACFKGVQCSECGLVYGTNDAMVAQRRREAIEGADKRVRKAMMGWFGIWVGYVVGGLGAMWFVDSQMPWGIVVFMVGTLSGLIWGSVGLGWVAARFAPEYQRRLLWLGWLETLPAVHMTWLSIGGVTVVGSVMALSVRLIGGTGGAGKDLSGGSIVIFGYVLFAFSIWGLGSLVMLFAWPVKMSQYLAEHEVVGFQPGIGMMWILGVMVYFMACFVGLMGGALGSSFIMSLGG